MALGERFRGTESSGVAEFLAGHQACDAGFDVTREEGPRSGRLKIACKGCGRSVEYRAAEAAEMASGPPLENGAPPFRAAAAAMAPDPKPDPGGDAPKRPDPPPATPRPAGGSRLPAILITAVIIGGIALIAAGLLRSGDDEDSGTTTASGAQAEQTIPTESEPEPQPAPTQPEPALPPALDRRAFFDRFAIGVPRGWRRSTPGGNLVLVAPGGAARIRVFSEAPARDPSELAGPTADFLAQEHPGATISKPKRVRFGGGKAVQVRAVYEGGEEVASLISAGDYSFLVIYLQRDGADEAVAAEGEAALASFRPR